MLGERILLGVFTVQWEWPPGNPLNIPGNAGDPRVYKGS